MADLVTWVGGQLTEDPVQRSDRLDKQIHRRIDDVGLFAKRQAAIRLKALLAGQTDDRFIARRSVCIESLKTARRVEPPASHPTLAIGADAY